MLVTMMLIVVWSMVACTTATTNDSSDSGKQESSGAGNLVGISMPTKSSERWIKDGANMVSELEKLGYKADLQYGEDVVENQISQIENMITKGAKLLIIAPIDGESLTDVLSKAEKQKIPVISYDRLIRKSNYVSYYATFDNFKVGVLQGQYIEEKLGLKNSNKVRNIELFAGSPDDNNAHFFYDGAMSVLQSYIDKGTLVVKSGQTKFEQIATLRWDGATAQTRMDNLLSKSYSNTLIDAVLCPNDGISIGVLSSLKGVGYGSASKPLPIITGQDAELASVKSIIAKEQTQTIFKDTRELAKKTVGMVKAIFEGTEVEVNDTASYHNGEKFVPSYLLLPVSVDISNYEEIIIDSGYFSKDDLK